jgi:PAP2 superfamily
VSAATTDGVTAHAGPARRAGRPGTGAARPRVAARAYGVAVTSAWARPRGARAGTGLVPGPVRNRRVSLAWPRLPAAAEVAIVAAGYAGYALVRLAVRASRPDAITHAAGLWRAERWLHVDIEPSLNHLAAARPVLAETAGYCYGLAHFIVTPLVLAWLWLRRPAAFGPLRSALVLATTAANVVFWTWPVAPPRFAVPGMTDVLVRYRILGAGDAHGPDSLVNLYAAMPSLHVAWAAWCAAAIVAATRGRWRHLAWLYPAATTFVVLATATTSCSTPPPAWPSPPWACSLPALPRGRMPPNPGRAAPCRRPPPPPWAPARRPVTCGRRAGGGGSPGGGRSPGPPPC